MNHITLLARIGLLMRTVEDLEADEQELFAQLQVPYPGIQGHYVFNTSYDMQSVRTQLRGVRIRINDFMLGLFDLIRRLRKFDDIRAHDYLNMLRKKVQHRLIDIENEDLAFAMAGHPDEAAHIEMSRYLVDMIIEAYDPYASV
ncbi:hypothetical protein FBU30_009745 [Linnemannia zychae]|nr:hypothetical protein FBU30_009745 [Linnemannia zychae]